MLSQQELSDRFEIQDLLYRYAQLIDSRQFEELRDVFTADVHVDYSAFGGGVGGLEPTLAFLRASLTPELFPNTQHLNANVQIEVDGDTATGRVMCFNPMQMAFPRLMCLANPPARMRWSMSRTVFPSSSSNVLSPA